MQRFYSVLRWIIIVIATIEVLGSLASIADPATQSTNIIKVVLGTIIVAVCLYFEKAYKSRKRSSDQIAKN